MSWSRIKTILIILFLFTDIFLAASIFVAKREETKVSPEVLDASLKILETQGITLSSSAVLPKIPSSPVLQADNAVTDYNSFALLILGEDYRLTAPDTYTSERGNLTFSGDKFSFKTAATDSFTGNLTQKSIKKAVFSYLKSLGLNMNGAKIVSEYEKDGIWFVTVRDFAEKQPVFSSEIELSLSQSGIKTVSGSWFNTKDTREQGGDIKSTVGLLVDFAEDYARPAEITSIEFGYSVFDNDNYHKSASLIPVNKLILQDGSEYFLDARAGE